LPNVPGAMFISGATFIPESRVRNNILVYDFVLLVHIIKITSFSLCHFMPQAQYKAELLQLNRTQFPSLGIFFSKKVGNPKN
jgi:hypothetical protein